MAAVDTKSRILDSAEHLFSLNGFHNTSMRSITGHANVNLAAINYHFGSKEALLQAVIKRRILPLNAIREKLIKIEIDRAKKESTLPNAEALLRAFIEPTIKLLNSSQEAREFISLIGRSLNEPDKTVRNCFMKFALPTFQLLFSSLSEAQPQLSKTILFARLQFIIGTMSHIMSIDTFFTPNNQLLPPQLPQQELMEQLLKYAIAGLEAPE